MKEVCDLDREQANFAWCFDCVPEENSLLLGFAEVEVEVPALDLVLAEPNALLGEPVHGRFGPEFPIRFDLLDTMSLSASLARCDVRAPAGNRNGLRSRVKAGTQSLRGDTDARQITRAFVVPRRAADYIALAVERSVLADSLEKA